MISDDALAFDRHLAATAPAVADIARALRRTVLDGFPDAVETFDAGDGLLAIGIGRSMRDFRFAIIPHRSHVNLQLADGVACPTRHRIQGTGKRVRHEGALGRTRPPTGSVGRRGAGVVPERLTARAPAVQRYERLRGA